MSEKNSSVDRLNQYLDSLLVSDTNTVMLMIYNSLVSWAHRTYKNRDEYQTVYDKFIQQTNEVIHRKPLSHPGDKVRSFRYEEAKSSQDIAAELSSLLDQLPPEDAIGFLSELTGTWCLLFAKEHIRKHRKDENNSNVKQAERLFLWLLRPFDFFW